MEVTEKDNSKTGHKKLLVCIKETNTKVVVAEFERTPHEVEKKMIFSIFVNIFAKIFNVAEFKFFAKSVRNIYVFAKIVQTLQFLRQISRK